jgi:uncharacterized membrane protein
VSTSLPAVTTMVGDGRVADWRSLMATLTVWKFEDDGGAARAEDRLVQLQKQDLIHVHDAALVSWPVDKKKPKTTQLNHLAGAGALGGAFWGLLFGLLFFIPLFGMAVGAAMGAIGGAMSDVGIDDDFIESVRSEIQPGTSALFLLSSDAVVDKVKDAFGDDKPHLLRTNLSDADEAKLREVFGDEG